MKHYNVVWFEGNGPLKPGIPDGTLPERMSAEFDTEGAALQHVEHLIQSGRHAVTLRGPDGLVIQQGEIEVRQGAGGWSPL